MHFFVKSTITKILKGTDLRFQLETRKMNFNEIWYQQHSFIGEDYALHLFKDGEGSGGSIIFFLQQLLVVVEKYT